MSKYKNKKIRKELIRRYYSGDYDPTISREVFDEFGSILVENEGAEERRAIFEKLWSKEQGGISDQRKHEILKTIIERIKNEDGFTLDRTENKTAKKRTLERRAEEKKTVTIVPFKKTIFWAAAVIIPAMILAGGIWMFNRSGDQAEGLSTITELIALRGETKDTVLPDSSKVWINSDSKVVFHLDNNEYRLASLEGECYFEVAKDKKKQFVVETKNLKVTVLGTNFNIKAYSDRKLTIITLDQGSLRVDLPSGVYHMITPGQQLVYDNVSEEVEIIDISESDEYAMSKWREGNQICYRMTLDEIFNTIERKYNYKINITDSTSLKSDRTYNAAFSKKDSPADILQVIRFMSSESFNYSVHGDEVTIK